MSQVQQFDEIDDLIDTLNLDVEMKFSDFLIYDYEQVNHDNFSRLSIFRQNYSETESPAKGISRDQEIYDEFKSLVQQYASELKSVQAYADKMHITPKHLSETVKKISGKGALEVIHQTQLNYAKALLRETPKTVSEVAYELNFSNPEYFSVFFKRLSGESPSQFRVS